MKKLLLVLLLSGFAGVGYAADKTPKLTSGLEATAEKIKSGKIKVGKELSMKRKARYHTIHGKVLGMDCTACHLEDFYAGDYLLFSKNRPSSRDDPELVDRAVCLGCHKEGGVATAFYGSAAK